MLENAGKKNKIISECFPIKNHGYTFVCFFWYPVLRKTKRYHLEYMH